MAQPTVIAVIDDLFFLAKVQSTGQQLGLTINRVTSPTALQDALRTATAPAMVVVDLTLRADDAVSLIKTARATEGGQTVPILAFGPHVAVDMRQQAMQAGADRVVAKSEFSQRLPALLQHFVTHGRDASSTQT